VPTRAYVVQHRTTLAPADAWTDLAAYGLGVSSASFQTGTTNQTDFYRLRAFRPLGP